MAERQGDLTAFRVAEKTYQRKTREVTKRQRGRNTVVGYEHVPTDLSACVDLSTVCPSVTLAPTSGGDNTRDTEEVCVPQHQTFPNVRVSRGPCGADVVSVADRPGLYVLPQMVPKQRQYELFKLAVCSLPDPPATTNHDAAHGTLPPALWDAAEQGLRLGRDPAGSPAWVREGDAGAPEATALLRRLRWASIGPTYDWTERRYRDDKPWRPLPAELKALAQAAVEATCGAAPRFEPDAALVNYYRKGDTLGGHRDDAERDQSQPLVAVSLGCAAVFLSGGATKEEPPTPLILRGGDVVVMAGPARQHFHGVPRVLTEDDPDWRQLCAPPADDTNEGPAGDNIANYMRSCRINISIRRVL